MANSKARPLNILVSNDDGVHAPGIRALYESLRKLGRVTVVAPLEERSTTGHSLTLHKPLRLHRIGPKSESFYGVTGSPADCIYMGIKTVLKAKPDLVVSGINRGANLGQDVHYSGTVSAAREACILGIPALAVSLCINFNEDLSEDQMHFKSAGEMACRVLKKISLRDFPEHTLLNLNVPNLPMKKIKGVVLGRQGFRFYSGDILRRKDHRGRDYFWVGGTYKGYKKEKGADCQIVADQFASLTPLKVDATDYVCLAGLAKKFVPENPNPKNPFLIF